MSRPASTRRPSVCVLSAHPLVLDDFARLLAGLRVLLRRFDEVVVPGKEGLRVPVARVYVLDAQGPRPLTESRLAALSRSFGMRRAARIIVVSEKFSEAEAFAFLRLGARGLLTYADAEKQLARAVAAVAAGGFWVSRAWLSRFVDSILGSRALRRRVDVGRLSRREQEVLDALLENLANKEIAARLNVSERTVKFHVSNVLAKFAIRRRADLILHFSQHGRSS